MLSEALILAGGAGTRLRPLVDDVPKPLAHVAGRPFIEYLLLALRSNGIGRAIVCTGYGAEAIVAHLGDGSAWGMEIEYSSEDSPLGTGGALRRAAPLVRSERCLVMNGDSFFDVPLAELDAEHTASDATLTLALAAVPDVGRYGSVTLDGDGNVSAFVEKAAATGAGLINAGVYAINRAALELIPSHRPVSFEREIMPALIGRGLRGRAWDGYFIDIGVPDDYLRAQADRAVWERLAGAR